MALAGANEGQKTYSGSRGGAQRLSTKVFSGSALFRVAVQMLNNYQIGNFFFLFLSSLGIYSFLCDVELKKNRLW